MEVMSIITCSGCVCGQICFTTSSKLSMGTDIITTLALLTASMLLVAASTPSCLFASSSFASFLPVIITS
ncbi:hypothetical protein ES703_36972 [subsurface metagenome]